jgi:ABC-type sugar transport system, permease component
MKRYGPSTVVFNIIAYTVIIVSVILCTLPFIMVIAGSFSNNAQIMKYGYSVWPRGFSLDGYRSIFIFPKTIMRSYMVSVSVTAIGTFIGLAFMTMCGYALNRNELKYRNIIAFIIYFTTLFSGGLVPWYMVVSGLGIKNSVWALILPMTISAFYILLIRNFMKGIPDSLVESAKIDGGGEFLIFLRIIIPLSTPIIATIGLFLGLAYWNDWYLASLYIKDTKMWPLQYRLYMVLTASSQMTKAGVQNFVNKAIPTETQKLANAVIATGPIILLYPFLQKYFVQGITIGAVKG